MNRRSEAKGRGELEESSGGETLGVPVCRRCPILVVLETKKRRNKVALQGYLWSFDSSSAFTPATAFCSR